MRGSCELGLPSGWFVVATSRELAPGATRTVSFMSEELVLYRTASGQARAVSPFCPHLGAHLGRCGTVVGETLRCDFHHFRFGADGACVATGYDTRPPQAARLAIRPILEQNGVILVHHDPAGHAPTWAPPVLDMTGWSPIAFQRSRLRGHPQETTENSVDIGHFSKVHGYKDVRALGPLRTEGAYLHARYAMRRGVGPSWLGIEVATEFDVHVHGLGYSFVEVEVVSHGVRLRQFVLATPTEPGWIDLRLGVSARVPGSDGPHSIGRAAARRLVETAVRQAVSMIFAHDVGQDRRVWENKRYVAQPALAEGDGPIGAYRRWATQFGATSGAKRLALAGVGS
jgi:nitrite reductase/ring-hydroxylating ferredoxin subunit